jgi:hypothetical protein
MGMIVICRAVSAVSGIFVDTTYEKVIDLGTSSSDVVGGIVVVTVSVIVTVSGVTVFV